jgi:hypothetical protein
MTGANVVKFPTRLSVAERAELRARAEVLAAEYGAPLPEGDAGLIEAEQRLHEVNARRYALYDEFDMDWQIEEEIDSITDPPWSRLQDLIVEREPREAAGAAVKLRHLLDALGEPWERTMVSQVIALLENEVSEGNPAA